ncbi:MAG: N-acetylneuraminate synthase family protein [Candidatus Diapherotrites archaeon]|nr:N-acetylneuraminate synthase family protein [Candidatus Diapherotrites archaeon]
MQTIKIGGREIGSGRPCYIIAEIGLNHNGSAALAKKMISAAKKCGADAVKFQAYKTAKFVDRKQKAMYDFLRKSELTEGQFAELKKYADKKKICFFASVWNFESADLMQKLKAPCFKIGSGELTNLPMLKHVAEKKKPVIVATGMAALSEIRDALNVIYSTGNRKAILLHCVSQYPPAADKLNLRKIQFFEKKFHVPVGFSDHSLGNAVAIAAVALGACVIEKHFTLDKTLPGPDQALSADIKELKELVESIRLTERALGSAKAGVVEPKEQRVLSRKSLYAAEEIKAGERITSKKIAMMRPAVGIEPKHLAKVIGKRAKARIPFGEVITWQKIQRQG